MAYSIHVDTLSNRQYVWNGAVSRYIDGAGWALHLDHNGKGFISNGVQSQWCEAIFQDTWA